MNEPKRRRWQYSLRTLLTLTLVCALALGIPKLLYHWWIGPMKDSEAGIQLAAMIQAYLDEHECAWPRSWDDLYAYYWVDGTVRGGSHCTFEEVRDCWTIDFQADPVVLAQADAVMGQPPFQVLRPRHDRPLARPHWDPNYRVFWRLRDHAAMQTGAMIVEYLKAHAGAWPGSWDDLRPCYDAARDKDGRHYCSFEQAQACMAVDFAANPAQLVQAKPRPNQSPFRVVHPIHPYPGEGEVVQLDTDPNQWIFEYLRSTLKADNGEWKAEGGRRKAES